MVKSGLGSQMSLRGVSVLTGKSVKALAAHALQGYAVRRIGTKGFASNVDRCENVTLTSYLAAKSRSHR